MTEGDGELGRNGSDSGTAPDIVMSPSWRATGDETNSPDEPRLLGVVAALAVVVKAASETGGQGASTILRVKTRETAAAERVGLVAAATAIGGSATDPKPASRRGV
jgi:hypothetical protein